MGLRLISHSFVFFCILYIQLAVMCCGRVVRLDDRDSRIVYSPGWTPNGDPSDYLMTTTQTNVLGSMMVIAFEGTKISIFGSVVPFAYGQAPSALFSIDDDPVGGDYIQPQPTVMINNAELPSRSQQLLFASPELPPGPHVLIVTILDVPGANPFFVFDYAEYESLDLLSSSGTSDTTPPATPASTPSPQAARFGESVDDFGVPGPSPPLALDASKTQVNSIQEATTTVQPSPALNDSASITPVSYSDTSSNMQLTTQFFTTTMSSTHSSSSSVTIASSISSTNQISFNARHILPLVIGIVITCLFLFLFAIGTFNSSSRATRRNLRNSRYSYSAFEGFPFRTFDPGASVRPSRDSDHIHLTPLPTPPASGHISDHPRAPSRPVADTEAFLFFSQGTPHTMLPSSPMTPTWSSISTTGFNGTADGTSGSGGQDRILNEDSVDAYYGHAPPPYRVRHSKIDAV